MRLVVTGANGFVGKHLVRHLKAKDHNVDAIVRHTGIDFHDSNVRQTVVNSLEDYIFDTNVDKLVVIHAAARAHILKDLATNPLLEYRKVNTESTLKFAENAAKSGVKRFVFISTIKVNGERTTEGQSFNAFDSPSPEDPYAVSKYEAELGLKKIAQGSGMEVVIIRPPLVYGRGVKGNFASLIKAVKRGLPLPLGSIHNKRSMVGIHNLVDLIECALRHPNAAGNTFLVSDGHDLSTTDLLRGMIKSSGSKSILLPIPPSVIQFVATILGKRDMSTRLLESLQVDISGTKDILGWSPPFSIQDELDSCFTPDNHD
jgi:nucleoside-diphosphate-sugar epimerase